MSYADLLIYGGEIVITAAVVFIAYRALRLRGVLVDRPYRTRALWAAIGGFSVVGFFGASLVDAEFPSTTVEGVLIQGAVWGFVFLVLYVWIATNIDVAISTDYFNRDALGWKGGGKFAAIGGILVAYIAASLPPWWIPTQYEGTGSTVIGLVFLAVSVYSAAVLAVTVRRIVDKSIRSYTKWVVISLVALFASIFTLGTGDVGNLFGGSLLLVWILCMNHSVTALAIRTRTLPT